MAGLEIGRQHHRVGLPRVGCNGKPWRLRFMVAQTEQLRVHFEDTPNPKPIGDGRRYRRRLR